MHGGQESDEQRGTLPTFGRRLRRQFDDTVEGLDDSMIGLLEKLFDVPGVTEDGSTFASRRRS
jgi:hypothetical protein